MAKQLSKEELERKKLQAEIESIKLNIDSEKSKMKFDKKYALRENLKAWAAVIIAILTIAGGALTLGVKVDTFFVQNEESHKIEVGEDMIKLTTKLNSGKRAQETHAAILLSSFGTLALPTLLVNLELAPNPAPTIEALEMIKKKVGSESVLLPLLEKAERVYGRELGKLNEMNYSALKNFAYALGDIGIEDTAFTQRIQSFLETKKDSIWKVGELDSAYKIEVTEAIDLVLKRIQAEKK